MYLPKHFRVEDQAEALQLAEAHPFATVLAPGDEPVFAHLPLLVERQGERILLTGHMARPNPLVRAFAEYGRGYAIFHGPHAYVSPRWYADHDVPTWNYAVVHMQGSVRFVDDEQELIDLLKKASARFEANEPSPWEFSLPADLENPKVLAKAIVGFELEVETMIAKFKLSQNRSVADRKGVIEGLASRTDDGSKGVREMMLKTME